MIGGKSCPSGQILRKGYTARRKSTGEKYRVSAKCITDRGKPGKGKRLFSLKKGALGKYGYKIKESPKKRHTALRKAVSSLGYSNVMKKVNALGVLMRNTEPAYAREITDDKDFIQNELGHLSLSYKHYGKSPRRRSSSRRKSGKRRKSPRRKSKGRR